MIATRTAALAFAFLAGSLATAGALTLSPDGRAPLAPKQIVAQTFDALDHMPAVSPALREALNEAARGDRQPILKTDRSVRIVTIEQRDGDGTSSLVRIAG